MVWPGSQRGAGFHCGRRSFNRRLNFLLQRDSLGEDDAIMTPSLVRHLRSSPSACLRWTA